MGFLGRGGNLEVIGKETRVYKKITEIQPKINQTQTVIIGGVIYIDNYGNVITNISEKVFNDIGKRRDFIITARRYTFKKILNKYNDVVDFESEHIQSFDGSKLAIFNSAGFLEIAIYKSNLDTVGGASSLLGLNYRDTITIEFFNNETPDFTPLS